jgi:hypothetical protein
VVQQGGTALDWARFASLVAASIAGVYVFFVLVSGYAFVTTDWHGFGCWDGNEPACDAPARPYGLSTVRTSSWILGSTATVAVLTAFVWSFWLRRPVHAAPALLLSAGAGAMASVLLSRVA